VSNWKKITKAVIPAAGFGTRMLPATKALPKEMLPVAGKPLIQYAVEEAAASGIDTVILVIRGNKSLIQDHFAPDRELKPRYQRGLNKSPAFLCPDSKTINIKYVQQESPLGLAHALSCAQPLMGDEPFVVLLPDVIMLADDPVTSQLIRAHAEVGGSMIAIREVEPHDVKRFGIVQLERSTVSSPKEPLRITGLVEKPSLERAPSRFGIFGRYLLEPSVWTAIAQTRADLGGEVQLTDALNILCQEASLFGVSFDGRHYDAGDRIGYLQANIELSLEDPNLREPLLHYLSGIACVNS
jgi:UTP--glucose-1-phosphate uridylyltransferase